MMRMGFLQSDFNPMVLMLGEAEDCRALAGILRQFVRDRADVSFAGRRFCRVVGADLVLTATDGAPGVEQHQSQAFVWRVPPDTAAAFAGQLDDLAGPDRIAGSEELHCGSLDGIAVKVSRGEYTGDFLRAPAAWRGRSSTGSAG